MSAPAESDAARRARGDLERRALRSDAEGSLRSSLERILAAGGYYANDDGCTIEKALVQYAGIMTKAVAIAMKSEGTDLDQSSTNIGCSELFSVDEAARALLGLSALMSEGYHLLHQMEMADELRER